MTRLYLQIYFLAAAFVMLGGDTHAATSDTHPNPGSKMEAGNPPKKDLQDRIKEPLPKNPDDLLKRGYKETSHPDAKRAGHREFVDPESGDTLRFDKGKPGEPGHKGQDHYHRDNPNATGKGDKYLDKNGNPVPDGSDKSHLYP